MIWKRKITYSGKFKKDIKKYVRQDKHIAAFTETLDILSELGAFGLPDRMKPHKLLGKYNGFWECHILPDFLLIWEQDEEPFSYIYLVRIGSHSELF